MVVHKENPVPEEPQYIVAAELCEPDYKAEFRYLRAEMAFVQRKLAEPRKGFLARLSLPGLGIFRHEDWRKYHHTLEHYGKQLEDYSEAVVKGVLPVKFAVYNASGEPDERVAACVRVKNGRMDSKKKPPARPERMDGKQRASQLKLSWPMMTGFVRRKIKMTEHEISAEFSALEAHDGATLINQLVHVHCGPDTEVVYEIRSKNVPHETGEVEL